MISDVHSEFNNCVVTLLVMSKFLNLLGASRDCMDFRDSIGFSRFNHAVSQIFSGAGVFLFDVL